MQIHLPISKYQKQICSFTSQNSRSKSNHTPIGVLGIKLDPQAAALESLDWKYLQAAVLAVNFDSHDTYLCLIIFDSIVKRRIN